MRLLYIASSHGRMLDYHVKRVDPSITVKGIWVSGIKTKAMHDTVIRRQEEIISYQATHIIVHLMHNDIAFSLEHNALPEPVPVAVRMLMSLIRFLRQIVPNAVIMGSCPFPRLPANGFSAAKCFQYNRMAVRAAEQMASLKFGLITVFTKALWDNVKNARTGSPACIKAHDGLHLTPRGKREVAQAWIKVCKEG